jgi:uncharacterized protein
MVRVGILSDTHGFLNPALFDFFRDCDELWHAGDWGDPSVAEKLSAFKPVRGVYGNIDGREIRAIYPEVLRFELEGLDVCMLHIGGYPGRYTPAFKQVLVQNKPDLMVCGHSHILKVMRDKENDLMHFNPGAAGVSGFHQVCTALRLRISDKKMTDLEVWEGKKTQF